jgi:hypothetical protein
MYETVRAGDIEKDDYVKNIGIIEQVKIYEPSVYLHNRHGSMYLFDCDAQVERVIR